MTVMGEVTGKEGVVTIDGSTLAVAEFSVKFERGVASYERVGYDSDFNTSGKLKVTGELKRMTVDGAMLARVVGEDVDGAWTSIGKAKLFRLVGEQENADASGNYIYLDDCFLTAGDFKFSDADTIIDESLPFIVTDPDSDVSGNYTL